MTYNLYKLDKFPEHRNFPCSSEWSIRIQCGAMTMACTLSLQLSYKWTWTVTQCKLRPKFFLFQGKEMSNHDRISKTFDYWNENLFRVLPDMIGGNAYRAQPTAELIIRWAEANALMPALQFSFLPWDYPSDEVCIRLLAEKTNLIMLVSKRLIIFTNQCITKDLRHYKHINWLNKV